MDINVYIPAISDVLSRIEQKLDIVLRTERRMENEMQLDFTKILAATAAQSDITNSALTAFASFAAKITDLSTQLAAAIAANDPVAQAAVQTQLDGLAQGITDNDTKLANAIATPGNVPTPPVTPAPIPTA